jgi:hypothetical protein
MMMFQEIAKDVLYVATNSLKEVRISRIIGEGGQYVWMLETPEGGLFDKFTSRGPFVTFEKAKRDAEMTVGFTMDLDVA